MCEVDYDKHYPPILSPLPTENRRTECEKDYKKMQSEMIYEIDSLPFPELIQELRSLVSRINEQKF
ncbi:MAG: hypothetical protein K9I94_14105 [Bacteroidales bacterium]|nr:hypothetical protein [Bacteroidales bacterium]